MHQSSFLTRRRFGLTALTGAAGLACGLGRTRAAEGPAGETNAQDDHSGPLGKADACVFLWLGGGAAQTDTFDPKRLGDPDARKAGSAYRAIPTAAMGVEVCEHLARLADRMDRVALIRSLHHDAMDEHSAATHLVHTGRPTSETIAYPSLGSIVARLKATGDPKIPAYALLAHPSGSRGPGFLGAASAPIVAVDPQAGPVGLAPPRGLSESRRQTRESLAETFRQHALNQRPDDPTTRDWVQAARIASSLAGPEFQRLFDLEEEPDNLRDAYGAGFGQRCLLARRLVEAGCRFVEVSHSLNFVNGTGWDTHNHGQKKQHILIQELDQALAALIDDLERRGRLDRTLIVVATEFGRPIEFDGGGGRGHQSSAFSSLLAGGGLKGGQAVGVTDEDAKTILERPVSIPDFHATILATLGISPHRNLHAGERPVPLTDRGQPLSELLG
mgnify:CR=1 FL=1